MKLGELLEGTRELDRAGLGSHSEPEARCGEEEGSLDIVLSETVSPSPQRCTEILTCVLVKGPDLEIESWQ